MEFNHRLQNNDDKRRILAQQIFHEVQEGYEQSSMDLFKSMYHEIENISDTAVDILLRQKNSSD
jgi:hypothetical protein